MTLKLTAQSMPLIDGFYLMDHDGQYISVVMEGSIFQSSDGGIGWVFNSSLPWSDDFLSVYQLGSSTLVTYLDGSNNVRIAVVNQVGSIVSDDLVKFGPGNCLEVNGIFYNPILGRFSSLVRTAAAHRMASSNALYAYTIANSSAVLATAAIMPVRQMVDGEYFVYIQDFRSSAHCSRAKQVFNGTNYVFQAEDTDILELSAGLTFFNLNEGGVIAIGNDSYSKWSNNGLNFSQSGYPGEALWFSGKSGYASNKVFSIAGAIAYWPELGGYTESDFVCEGVTMPEVLEGSLTNVTNGYQTRGILNTGFNSYLIDYEQASNELPEKGAYDRLIINTMNHARFLNLK